MFLKLMDKMNFPSWATPRYKKLLALSRMIEGTFYDHLQTDFYTEVDYSGKYIPLVDRRPAAMSLLAKEIVSQMARKLFAGRHVPRFTHDNALVVQWMNQLAAQAALYEKMNQAMLWGAVGSVAVTFRLVDGALRVDVWRPWHCTPSFDGLGGLSSLRVQYTTGGAVLRRMGFTYDIAGEPLDGTKAYWFVRDWTATQEITYVPVPDGKYNPVEGPEGMLEEMADKTFTHNLGFVPGVWIVNLPGGDAGDGLPTIDTGACSNIVDLDYTISQLGRGIRYSAAPQLVIIGELDNDDAASVQRGPTTVLRLKSSWADDSQKLGGSDAKLLEMVGNGTQVGLNYVDLVKKTTLQALSASVRGIQTHTGTVSGRAMEVEDDAYYDIVNAFRTSYGDGGVVPLMSKIMAAFVMTGACPLALPLEELTGFGIRWPRVFSSTPTDEMSIVESMSMAVQQGLIDMDVAREYLNTQLDLDDYKLQTPPQTGSDAANNAPAPQDADSPEDDKYQQGSNTDIRRPGPNGTMLPRKRVGQKQQTL
jgi:hypothetical protein